MEVEVASFLDSLPTNLKKADIDAHSQTLLLESHEWITTLQKQIRVGFWNDASLDKQLSVLYVLNAYLKEAYRQKMDLDIWLPAMDMMLNNLHFKDSSNEKEVKHVLKLVAIWGNKEKDPKLKSHPSKRRLSIFPKEECEKWLAAITGKAVQCGIKFSTAVNEGEANSGTGVLPVQRSGMDMEPTIKPIQNTSMGSKPFPTSSNKHQAFSSSALSVPIIPALPTPLTSSSSAPYSNDIAAQLKHDFIQAVCKFQMHVFQSFACHATRRLDRWNMNIVMLSSFHLLHLYFQEYGAIDASPAPLVVACIYLSGKSEYLFVKADKLRQVANKFVRDLNEPVMDSNLQVYKYEAQLLRMLQYNVGSIPNPLRILKALDILEANSQSPKGVPASLDPVTLSGPSTNNSSSGNNGTNAGSAVNETSTATNTATAAISIDALIDTTNSVPASTITTNTGTHAAIVVSLKSTGLSQARRLIDDAVAVFVKEEYLFNLNTHDLILSESDFFVATAVLLEKTHRAFGEVDKQECERKSSKFLHQLSGLSPSLRLNQVLAVSGTGLPARNGSAAVPSIPSKFIGLLLSLRLPKEPKPPVDTSQMEEGEILTSDTNSTDPFIGNSSHSALLNDGSSVRHGTALFAISTGCIELVNRVLPRVEQELYEAKVAREYAAAMKARAGMASSLTAPSVPSVPSHSSMSVAPMLAGPVQTLLSRSAAPTYPVHPSRVSMLSAPTAASSGPYGGARDPYSSSQDNRGEKRARDRSRSPPREHSAEANNLNKKRRWDTYGEPDRYKQDYDDRRERDSRDYRDISRDHSRRDREDSRERRRRADIEAQAVEDAFLYEHDSQKRSRREPSPHHDRHRSHGHSHSHGHESYRDTHHRDHGDHRDHQRDHRGEDGHSRRREDSRDRSRYRPRSPPVPPPPPRIPPPPPLPPPPSIPDVPGGMPGSSHKRPRSNSRSPGRHKHASNQPPPPSRSARDSTERFSELRSGRDNKRVSLPAQNHPRVAALAKMAVDLEDGEEGEINEDGELLVGTDSNSNYCQFIGTSTGNNTNASSAQASSAPTPFVPSAPSAPRVGFTQSASQSWMPNEEEDDEVVVLANPTSAPASAPAPAPVVDLTCASPIVNTSTILPLPNIAKLTQLLAARSASGTAAAAVVAAPSIPLPPPVLVVPPVLTVPTVASLPPALSVPVSAPFVPLIPVVVSTSVTVQEEISPVPNSAKPTDVARAGESDAPAAQESAPPSSASPVSSPLVSMPVTAALSPKSDGSSTSNRNVELAEHTAERSTVDSGSKGSCTTNHLALAVNGDDSADIVQSALTSSAVSVAVEVMKAEVAADADAEVEADDIANNVVRKDNATPEGLAPCDDDASVPKPDTSNDPAATSTPITAACAATEVTTTAATTTATTGAAPATASIITATNMINSSNPSVVTEPKSRIVTIPKMVSNKERNIPNTASSADPSPKNNSNGNKSAHSVTTSAATKHGKNNNNNAHHNSREKGNNRNDNSSRPHHNTGNSNTTVSPSDKGTNKTDNKITIQRTASKEDTKLHSLPSIPPNDARHLILHSQVSVAGTGKSDTSNYHRHTMNTTNNNNRTSGSGTASDNGSSTSSSSSNNNNGGTDGNSGDGKKSNNNEDNRSRAFLKGIRSILSNPAGSRIRK